jgi:tRNA G18 (ribose-2'-O)-methylase SpoU
MKKELYLILHNIRSAYNVGAILRSADGAGVEKVYLTGYTAVPCMEDKADKTSAEKMIEKTALGAERSVVWEKIEKLEELFKKLQKEKVHLVGLEKIDRAIEIKKYTPIFPMALILGHEVDGVTEEILEKCEDIISIPMHGKKESLNVSVAAGIAMYEILV